MSDEMTRLDEIAERQACGEEAWRAYELLRDGIARQSAQRLAAGPSIIRTITERIDAALTTTEEKNR